MVKSMKTKGTQDPSWVDGQTFADLQKFFEDIAEKLTARTVRHADMLEVQQCFNRLIGFAGYLPEPVGPRLRTLALLIDGIPSRRIVQNDPKVFLDIFLQGMEGLHAAIKALNGKEGSSAALSARLETIKNSLSVLGVEAVDSALDQAGVDDLVGKLIG